MFELLWIRCKQCVNREIDTYELVQNPIWILISVLMTKLMIGGMMWFKKMYFLQVLTPLSMLELTLTLDMNWPLMFLFSGPCTDAPGLEQWCTNQDCNYIHVRLQCPKSCDLCPLKGKRNFSSIQLHVLLYITYLRDKRVSHSELYSVRSGNFV